MFASCFLALAPSAYLPVVQQPPATSRVAHATHVTACSVAAAHRSCGPRMALIDTLARRGVEAETETDSAFYSASENTARVEKYTARVEKINALEDAIELLSDDELRQKTEEFRGRLLKGESEDALLEEAFAVVREAAWRTLELRHYDVQLIGAMALNDGYLAQMGTGEGKTLVACAVSPPSRARRLLVTANDYLAARRRHGAGVQLPRAERRPRPEGSATADRRAAYASDVTYVTNSELGFDYLRDHLAMTPEETVLRDRLHFAVVDRATRC